MGYGRYGGDRPGIAVGSSLSGVCVSRLVTTQWSKHERLAVKSFCEPTNHAFGTTVPTSLSNNFERNGLARGWTNTTRFSGGTVQECPVPSCDYQWRRDSGEIRRR